MANGTLDDIFRVCVLPKLLALVDANPEIQIVLVPHVNDAIARATSFPQAPFINKQKLNGLSKSRRGGLKTGLKTMKDGALALLIWEMHHLPGLTVNHNSLLLAHKVKNNMLKTGIT